MELELVLEWGVFEGEKMGKVRRRMIAVMFGGVWNFGERNSIWNLIVVAIPLRPKKVLRGIISAVFFLVLGRNE